MAYPPVIPPNTRVDGTTMATNHPDDHNDAADALTEIVNRIGNSGSPYASYPNVEARFNAYGRPAAYIVAHTTSTDAWKEAADYIVVSGQASNNTVADTATTDLNAILTLMGLSTAGGFGGGEMLFAPTMADLYNFGPTNRLNVPSGVRLRFLGGLGKNAAFFGSGSFDPTDVQAWFQGGLTIATKSKLICDVGTYIFNKSVDITGGNVYIGGGGEGNEELTRFVMHTSFSDNYLIDCSGPNNSNRINKVKITDIYFHGKDLGKPLIYGIYAGHMKIRDCVFYASGATGAPSASVQKAGIYLDGVWDSYIDWCRFEYCGTKGQTSVNTSTPESSSVRGALHIVSASDQANNIQVTNCTWENLGDCAYWLTGSSATGKANKCYASNLKVEDHIRQNFPIIYTDQNSFCTWHNVDLTVGTPATSLAITPTDQWRITNSLGCSVTNLNLEPIATAKGTSAAPLDCTTTGASVTTMNFTGATLGTNECVNWTVHFLSGSSSGQTKTITSHTASSLTWSGGLNLASGDDFVIYAQNISSFIKFNGSNKKITINGNVKMEAKEYHYPTVSFFEFAGQTDDEIDIPEALEIEYNPAGFGEVNVTGGSYDMSTRRSKTRVTTTDATVTAAQSFAIPTNKVAIIETEVLAHRTDGTSDDGGYWKIIGTYKNDAGTVTAIGGPTTVIEHKSNVNYECDFAIYLGAAILVNVTGVAAHSITWSATTKVRVVSS